MVQQNIKTILYFSKKYAKIILSKIKDVISVSNAALKRAMENAEASINMEGLTVSDACKELCEKLMKKEITFEEYLKQVTAGAVSHGI